MYYRHIGYPYRLEVLLFYEIPYTEANPTYTIDSMQLTGPVNTSFLLLYGTPRGHTKEEILS